MVQRVIFKIITNKPLSIKNTDKVGVVACFSWFRAGSIRWLQEHGDKTHSSIKDGKFLEAEQH
jgi:hypothetical protein